MFKVISKKIVLSLSGLSFALGVFMMPTLTPAAENLQLSASTPTAYLERSQIIGTGNQIKVYRLPITNSKGEVNYYDVILNLNVKSGEPKSAKVTYTDSPDLQTLSFVPGTYSDDNQGTCTLGISTDQGGRTAGALICKDKNGYILNANWFSGPIAGHPYEEDLKAAGIDQIQGATNLAWGQATADNSYGKTYCFNGRQGIISAAQVGNVLTINNLDNDNKIDCIISFILVQ